MTANTSSADLLRQRGVEFEEIAGGAHLRIPHEGRLISFWPERGNWIDMPDGRKSIIGHDVQSLLAYLDK